MNLRGDIMDKQEIDITNWSAKDILEYCEKAFSGDGIFTIEYGFTHKRWVTVSGGYACFVEESIENGLVYNKQKEILNLSDLGICKGYLLLWVDDYFISQQSGKALVLDLYDAVKIVFMEL